MAFCLFCPLFSDDTGCPSSQSVSPVKTPPDTGHSPVSFCTGSDGDHTRKKFNSGTMGDGMQQSARYKKETKTSLVKPGKGSSDFVFCVAVIVQGECRRSACLFSLILQVLYGPKV